MKTSIRIAAILLVASTVPAIGAGTAHAQGDNEVIRNGSCSGNTNWKIKAKPDDGRLEVEAEIDSNRAGQTWQWRLRHDGRLAARGSKLTTGRSGSFEVERHLANHAGRDSFKFRAVNRRSGEVCIARVTL